MFAAIVLLPIVAVVGCRIGASVVVVAGVVSPVAVDVPVDYRRRRRSAVGVGEFGDRAVESAQRSRPWFAV